MADPHRRVVLGRSVSEGPQHPQKDEEGCKSNDTVGPRGQRQHAHLQGPCAGQSGNCWRERHGHSLTRASSQGLGEQSHCAPGLPRACTGPQAAQWRTWPSPSTIHLVVVSSARPIGPRACSFWVEMPISAPNPNSPPSVNRVEALTMTAAASTSAVQRRAAPRSSVTIASVWPVLYRWTWANASSSESTIRALMSSERYSRAKSSSVARVYAAPDSFANSSISGSPWTVTPAD